MRRTVLAAVCCVAAAALASCGGGRREPPRDESVIVGQRPDGTQMAVRPGRDPNAAYIQATELKAKGDCTSAVMLLRPIAMIGPGYENAQTALGECLVEDGNARADGLMWLARAADAGWPEAQAALAIVHAADTPSRSAAEAAYWLALYDANPSKARVGFRAPDAKALARVRESLSSDDVAAGARRAASWERKLWLPPQAPEGQGLKPEQGNLGGMRRMRRPR
jgi:TPR repeat protein